MFDVHAFSNDLRAKLQAAGFTENEVTHGAMMAEMQAAMKMIQHPIVAHVVSVSFSRAMTLLSERDNVEPQRICAASDLIFEAAMNAAKGEVERIKAARPGPGAMDASPARRRAK